MKIKLKFNRLILLNTALLILVVFSCKKNSDKSGTVVRDCSGTYLRFENKDYHVCNLEKVAPFEDGTVVTANYKQLDACNGSGNNQIVCAMYHPHEGWIQVLDIK